MQDSLHPTIPVKIFAEEGSWFPEYKTTMSSGFDLHSMETIPIPAQGRIIVSTGLYLEAPAGFEFQIRPRSGQAWKKGITVLNTPGTIDADFRSVVKVILYNSNKHEVQIDRGERIAQAILCPIWRAVFIPVEKAADLSLTERGEGGFGSTGIN
jgi:dUTP pyrophosphatase